MMSLRVSAILIGLAFAVSVPAGATVVRLPLFTELVARADTIVVTEVVEVRVEPGRGGASPVTLVTFRVRDMLKGTPAIELALEFTGGRFGDDLVEVRGQPRFEPGDLDVLFLRADRGALSPVLGVFAGRFRIQRDASGQELVGDHHGRVLSADLSGPPLAAGAGQPPLVLQVFRRVILETLTTSGLAAARATKDAAAAATLVAGPSMPGVWPAQCLLVELGPSPSLEDGCLDWPCVVSRALESAALPGGAPRVVLPGDSTGECASVRRLAWAREVLGRTLDDLTLAVTVDREHAGTRSTATLLNRAHAWNSYAVPSSESAAITGAVDARRVLAEAMSEQPAADDAAAATAMARPRVRPLGPSGETVRGSRAGSAPEPELWSSAFNGCDPGSDALVNPRLLVFHSSDHAVMTAYQVGFFLPGAASPASVVDMPLTAFLDRRVFDLPPAAEAEVQRTLVANITGAGLSTPLGVVYTYRVRGVWSRGHTAWSSPSPRLVRCPGSPDPRP